MTEFENWWNQQPLSKATALPLLTASFRDIAKNAWDSALQARPEVAAVGGAEAIEILRAIDDSNVLFKNSMSLDARVANFLHSLEPQSRVQK